jgi:hypothetical protein
VSTPDLATGAGSDLATDKQIRAFELAQLTAYYQSAPPALRSFAWALLQLDPSPQIRPALVALMLTLDLLEREECVAYQKETGDNENVVTQEQLIAGFWSGKQGAVEDSSLVEETPESERYAITCASRVLFALPQLATVTDRSATGYGLDISPELAGAVQSVEERSLCTEVNLVEADLLAFLAMGQMPGYPIEDRGDILDALNHEFTLEEINISRRAWRLSMKRFQARLLEFSALEIPAPKELTEADVEAMRREVEEADTEQHLSRV